MSLSWSVRVSRACALAAVLALSLPSSSGAQRLSDARTAMFVSRPSAHPVAMLTAEQNALAFKRTLAGMIGLVVGAAVGGAIGFVAFDLHCYGCWVPIVGTVVGGGAGALFGTAGYVAMTEGEHRCSGGARFGLALLGALVGAGAGAGVIHVMDDVAGPILAFVFIPATAALFQLRC